MEGPYAVGWYRHPSLGLIRVFVEKGVWLYRCYSESGDRVLSRDKTLDSWTWAFSVSTDKND